MMNHIWAFLVAAGLLVAFATALRTASDGEMVKRTVDGVSVEEKVTYDTLERKLTAIGAAGSKLTKDIFNSVSFTYTDPETGNERSGAVGIAIGFIGLMAIWLGFMKVAEASGLIQLLARAIAPLFRFIFPTVPAGHPAQGSILMNYAANMLGLDNAATPLGIKAMKELQELNGDKETASNAQVMFVALNVSSLVILPASIIALRAQQGSVNPTSFWMPMLLATAAGTISAFIYCKIGERFSRDTKPAGPPKPPPDEPAPSAAAPAEEERP